jgi:small subunit ribosomal protein S17e
LDRIRRLSELAMQRHPDSFGTDYDKNKQALEDMALIPSKQLRNHVAGYITRVLRIEKTEDEEPKGETPEE